MAGIRAVVDEHACYLPFSGTKPRMAKDPTTGLADTYGDEMS